ncbi:Uncharacterised protein [Vibrio cholerae]|nr:Uncharacterised protein [Vibrio cholerae]
MPEENGALDLALAITPRCLGKNMRMPVAIRVRMNIEHFDGMPRFNHIAILLLKFGSTSCCWARHFKIGAPDAIFSAL